MDQYYDNNSFFLNENKYSNFVRWNYNILLDKYLKNVIISLINVDIYIIIIEIILFIHDIYFTIII